jgi:Brp/Blh family beta-carotene 15,15'-monooxygenase
MLFSNRKYLVHHFFFILLSVILLLCYSKTQDINDLSSFDLPPILFGSFILIGTLGLGHGALDGKIIWNASAKTKVKIKIYLIYLLIASLALSFWIISNITGLILLFLMSIVHFGESDMEGYQINVIEKLSWGCFVTFIPLIFRPDDVNIIFKNLADLQINQLIYSFILILFLLSLAIWIRIIVKKKYLLIATTMIVMMALGYLYPPLVWFAYYFCCFHGIRAIINVSSDLKKDILWMLLFSLPILFIWFYLSNFTKISINSIVFPSLFALTVAHMMLQRIIKKVSI